MSAIFIMGYHTGHAVLLSVMNIVFHISWYSYNEIIRIHLITYLYWKLVNRNFIVNWLTVWLTSYGSLHCQINEVVGNVTQEISSWDSKDSQAIEVIIKMSCYRGFIVYTQSLVTHPSVGYTVVKAYTHYISVFIAPLVTVAGGWRHRSNIIYLMLLIIFTVLF